MTRSRSRALFPRLPLVLLLGAALGLSACASSASPYHTAEHWSKEGYEWPPGASADQSAYKSPPEARATHHHAKQIEHPQSEHPQAAPRVALGSKARTVAPEPTRAPLHSPDECLRELRKNGVSFVSLAELKGVENPVEIKGPLGGVTFWANDGRAFELDCRLALALHRLAPLFAQYGLTRARYSGAYSYRTTKSGRLSHHALGLAIDLHDLSFGSQTLSVQGDFSRGVGCSKSNPALNRLTCALLEERLFEEFLTPDYNSDHRDHLHISVPRRSRAFQ